MLSHLIGLGSCHGVLLFMTGPLHVGVNVYEVLNVSGVVVPGLSEYTVRMLLRVVPTSAENVAPPPETTLHGGPQPAANESTAGASAASVAATQVIESFSTNRVLFVSRLSSACHAISVKRVLS